MATSRQFHGLWLASRLAIAAVGLLACVTAGGATVDDSPALFESRRARVTLADFDAEVEKLQPGARAQFATSGQRVMQVLNAMYLNRAAANEARAAGLDRDPVIARQIEAAVDKVLAQAQFGKVDRDHGLAVDANPDKFLARAREIYAAKPEQYRTREKVRVSHLLVRTRGTGNDAAKARAEELRAKAAAGAPFADLAREASDDPNAKRNGGDLGFVDATSLDPPFAAAAFALKVPGELSPVIKGASGYHVIQLHERQPPAQLSFEEVKSAIMVEVRQEFIEAERSAYQSSLMEAPAPAVNEKLIEKIILDARATALATTAPAPPRR